MHNPIIWEAGNAKADLMSGSLTGYLTFTGAERLILTTDAALTAGTYEVQVHYLSVARVNVTAGRISVMPS